MAPAPSTASPLSPALLQAAHARARQWAERFRLPLRQRVWRGAAGDFMGRGTGSSLDFQDHRTYLPGDDIRHINWQAFARTGQYSMKLFREEVRPLVDIVLDVSQSMFFDAAKAARAAELFYFAVESARQAGAMPAVTLAAGPWFKMLPADAVMSHRWPELLPDGPQAASAPLEAARLPWRAQSLRVLISDLLFAGAPEKVTSPLAARQGRPVIFAPFCQAESDPDWDGNMDFIDSEEHSHHPRRVEPALLRRYREAYARHFALWQAASRRHGVLFARVPSEPVFPSALQLEALPLGAVESWA